MLHRQYHIEGEAESMNDRIFQSLSDIAWYIWWRQFVDYIAMSVRVAQYEEMEFTFPG
jgi:hypothetical protein